MFVVNQVIINLCAIYSILSYTFGNRLHFEFLTSFETPEWLYHNIIKIMHKARIPLLSRILQISENKYQKTSKH